MKQVYKKIWELAKPYYQKGRPFDIKHIEWMMGEAFKVCREEGLDDSILLPLVILHDVGYSEIPKDVDYYDPKFRKAHMKAGAKIAKRILKEVDYPKDKADKIVYYVSVHDNWAFNDRELYEREWLLGVFNDLDWIWTLAPEGYPAIKAHQKKNDKEMLEYIKTEQEKRGKFFTKATKKLYKAYLKNLVCA